MKYLSIFSLLFCFQITSAQLLSKKNAATRADTIRGTYNENRSWWDVEHYDLNFQPDYGTKTISGSNEITFRVLNNGSGNMQLDLQVPMQLDSVMYKGKKLSFVRDEQAYIISFTEKFNVGGRVSIKTYFHGKPREAIMPPWDGGLIWTKDDLGNPWISVACQGLGASVWWPCKDHGLDEPDSGATVSIITPGNMVAVSNGNLKNTFYGDNYNTYQWDIKSPINNYNITMNIGKYNKFEDVYNGLSGPLKLEFWFLEQHATQAKSHLLDETKEMLKTFEYWFGPYPFYKDGYKLIETPFLGMEHQSGIAYGNKFKKGYLGSDLSGSGWGLKWDYILVHESGHEWFGNNISAKDVADMWIHEGFTTYSEVLFVESRYGKKAADEYAKGLRRNIQNDKPIIGEYNINREGSGDMYFKGVQIIHTYRQILNDDVKFRNMLHEMNKRFGLKNTTTQEVEALMQEYTDVNLSGFFDTYLRSVKIPHIEYVINSVGGKHLMQVWFTNTAGNFMIPVNMNVGGKNYRLMVGNKQNSASILVNGKKISESTLGVDDDYYILQ